MQIIIPMSGFGERFRRAGYDVPKPLIEVEGKPIISHVIDLFPNEENFIFICNEDHLSEQKFRIKEILMQYCPTGTIVGIPAHKLGPVHAVQQIRAKLNLEEPTVVNYCDFTCYWNWFEFKDYVLKQQCAGAIPAYKGFHPHSLGKTNYAYMQEHGGQVTAIQEKQPFTDNRMDEYASSGTYYFSSAEIMLSAFDDVVEKYLQVGNEYYVSLAYRYLFNNALPVVVYPLQHFMQWGTPEDVEEYNHWSSSFRALLKKKSKISAQGATIIPMAGLGQRFADKGYKVAKPLIPVSGKSMVLQATASLPETKQHCFVLREDMHGYNDIKKGLVNAYPDAVIKSLTKLTEGQACTALIGLEALMEQVPVIQEPITFGACDYSAVYDQYKFQTLLNTSDADVIVWGVRGHFHAIRNPQMYGWIDEKNGKIKSISVKKPLLNINTDPIVLGTFSFKKAHQFQMVVNQLIANNDKVNNEFYLDSCINQAISLGLNCYLFEVDNYFSWGTPDDFESFQYWQSCFHKWSGHPYRLEFDSTINADLIDDMDNHYRDWSI